MEQNKTAVLFRGRRFWFEFVALSYFVGFLLIMIRPMIAKMKAAPPAIAKLFIMSAGNVGYSLRLLLSHNPKMIRNAPADASNSLYLHLFFRDKMMSARPESISMMQIVPQVELFAASAIIGDAWVIAPVIRVMMPIPNPVNMAASERLQGLGFHQAFSFSSGLRGMEKAQDAATMLTMVSHLSRVATLGLVLSCQMWNSTSVPSIIMTASVIKKIFFIRRLD